MKTISCKSARDAWLRAADQEPTPQRRSALRNHLAACGDCRAWTAAAGQCFQMQKDTAPDLPLNPATRAAIRLAALRLRPRQSRPAAGRPFSLPAMAAAMLVFAGLAVWQWLKPVDPAVTERPVRQLYDPVPLEVSEIGALVYLLDPVGNGAEINGAEEAAPLSDSLLRWILRVQAGETLEYLDDRLGASS